MKLIDEKGRLFGVLNIIDILIVLCVVILCSVVFTFFSASLNNQTKVSDEYKITLEIKRIKKDLATAPVAGEKVFDKVLNKAVGEILESRYTPYKEYVTSTLDGTSKISSLDGYCDLYIDIIVPASDEFYVGKLLSMTSKSFAGAGFIVDLEMLNN